MLRADPVLAFQTGEKSGMAAFLGTHPRKRVIVLPADSENFQIVAYHPEDRWVERFTQSRSSIIKDVPAARAVEDFLDFHPSVQKMLASAVTLDVWRIRDLDQLPVWHSGKAILIGDAAHAVTPREFVSFSRSLSFISLQILVTDSILLSKMERRWVTSSGTLHLRHRYLPHSPTSRLSVYHAHIWFNLLVATSVDYSVRKSRKRLGGKYQIPLH
jgi:hypothetical protein